MIAAVAPTTNILIAGRVVMGIGAAASEPGTLSMIRHLYPGRDENGHGPWASGPPCPAWAWPWAR